MTKIMFKGAQIETNGNLPKEGSIAPEFNLVKQDLTEIKLSDLPQKKKIFNIVPSLDTGVCATSFKSFKKKLGEIDDVLFFTVSKDLPFAQGRFCSSESLPTEETLSAFRSTFASDYGLEIATGPLKGLCSRVVIILDENNRIVYLEQVPEITEEPNYDKALKILGLAPQL